MKLKLKNKMKKEFYRCPEFSEKLIETVECVMSASKTSSIEDVSFEDWEI